MKAAIFHRPNEIKIENTLIDFKSPNNLSLKVLSCSICSYDVRTFRFGSHKVSPPIILGHEICAETIDEFAGDNFSIKPKTRVAVYPVIPCFNCWFCTHKNYNLCSHLREIGSTINGGFAEYVSIPKKVFEIGGIVPILDDVTNEEASLIEPLACCINSLNQIRSLDFNSIVIIGDGPIAMMQIMLLKRFFPDKQIGVIGKIAHRLEMAKKMGANMVHQLESGYEPTLFSQLLKELNGNDSPNLIFISNNNPFSLKIALNLANKNGKIVIFSGLKSQPSVSEEADFNSITEANFIHYNQISIFGSFSSTPENLREANALINSRELRIKDLITHTFALENIHDALTTSESYVGLKSIINKFD